MAEPDHTSISPSSSSITPDFAGAASTSSTSDHLPEEEDHHVQGGDQYRHSELDQRHTGISYTGNTAALDETVSSIRDDTWSCVIVILTFWFFVSMTLILGVFGSANLLLGPNSSILIQPNPLFLQSVKVEELDETNVGLTLQGFHNSPPLDVVTTWDETHNVSIPYNSHKELIYYLNKGSEINISYSVKSSGSYGLLIIAQGYAICSCMELKLLVVIDYLHFLFVCICSSIMWSTIAANIWADGLSEWLEDPTYPNTTLSWNLIYGSGLIHEGISTSSSYYVAVGNFNTDKVEVELNISIRALLYNTTEAYYKCTFTHGQCSLEIPFPEGIAVILTSPGVGQGTPNDQRYVRLSYGARWATYIVGIGAMTVFMILAFNFMDKFQCTREDSLQHEDVGSERAPLIPYKDDDLSSWGSSYDSASQDVDFEDFMAGVEGKFSNNGETNNNTRRLCAICFDAPRDCFFLPCGHCVACFECGTRIVEVGGTCPVCCRNMKKVRKIFTV